MGKRIQPSPESLPHVASQRWQTGLLEVSRLPNSTSGIPTSDPRRRRLALRQKAISFTVILAIVVLAGPAALAQPTADPRPASAARSSGFQQPQSTGLTEDFNDDTSDGWEYSCQHAYVTAGTGRALATRGGGHAVWVAAGEVRDFGLKLRYGYEQGVGDVFFRATQTPQGMEFYFLRLEPRQVVLGRRLHTPDQRYPEKVLAAVPFSLHPRAWHEVIIQAQGGRIAVAIDEQGVLQVQDPAPLSSGLCGLGAIANSGHVLYDQITLIRQEQASDAPSEADAATWP